MGWMGKGGVRFGASVLSPRFVAYVGWPNRRSFDSVWRKNTPNYAQDDSVCLLRTFETGHSEPLIERVTMTI
jgi:hypothetical protein